MHYHHDFQTKRPPPLFTNFLDPPLDGASAASLKRARGIRGHAPPGKFLETEPQNCISGVSANKIHDQSCNSIIPSFSRKMHVLWVKMKGALSQAEVEMH